MVVPALGNIAQREQIMVILAAPWLVMQLPREGAERPGVTAALAGMAALGICLKPFFLLIPAAVTLWQVIVARSLRPVLAPANLVMGCVGLAYVGAALLCHPEYFRDVIPVAQDVYGSITFGDGVARFVLALNAAPFVLFGGLLLRRGAAPAGTGGFVAAALAGLGCYILQWNGFGYHMIPFAAFATMAAVWVICRAGRLAPVTLAAAIALVLGGGLAALRGTYSNPMAKGVLSALDPSWTPDGVITLSTHVPDGPPLAARLNTRWVSRYPHAWLVPGALNGRGAADCVAEPARCGRLGAILDRTRSDYISDIRAGKPDLLVVNNRSGYIDDPNFSWYRFMAEAPGWAEAFSDYRKIRSTPSHDIWLRCTGATGAIADACMAAGA